MCASVNGATSHEDKHAKETMLSVIDLKFASEQEAYDWCNEYAKGNGFSIRREYRKRDKKKKSNQITHRRFVCFKEGHRDKSSAQVKKPRKTIRTGCEARMTIVLRFTGKYKVIDFEPNHNHEFVDTSISHILPSQQNITKVQAVELELADDSGIQPKLAFELLSRHAGRRENLGFTYRDQRNYLWTKRKNDLKFGEVGSLLNYFQNQLLQNLSFFFAVQIDDEDQITNFFWADHRMVMDYNCFGDAVFFDTTYRTNKDCRPFGVFVGLNHHYQQVVFGACLLYDETHKSFERLFDTFLKCMSNKKLCTIFTDQDTVMVKAISILIPETHHRLCIWHINQNALKNLSHVFKNKKSFRKDFDFCIYDCEDEEEFFIAWRSMLDKYNLCENNWLKDLFKLREKWAMAYGRQYFSAGKKALNSVKVSMLG